MDSHIYSKTIVVLFLLLVQISCYFQLEVQVSSVVD